MSVSFLDPKMKRKNLNNNWRDKLSPAGITYLENRRSQQMAERTARKQPPVNVVKEVVSGLKKFSSQSANNQVDIAESAALRALVESNLREMLLEEAPSVNNISTFIANALEQIGPEASKVVALVLAIPVHFLWSVVSDVRKRHYGYAKITPRESLWVLGTALEEIGNICSTGDTTPITKGRVNVGLLEAIKGIRKHEQKKLSYEELKDAIEYAGLHCPEVDQLRLFVFRARKEKRL